MAEIGIGVLVKVIEKPIDLLWNFISKPITVLYNCKKNVENLKKEAVELKKKLHSVEEYAQYVERRGEEMGNDPKTWLTDTNQLISETDRVFSVDQVDAENKCFFGVCFNPVSRHKLSKKAAKNSVSIAQQMSKATGFKIPDYYAPAPVVEVASAVKGFEEFDSRIGVLDQIMEGLQSTGLKRIGLYGMAGAGKTTLVKEIKRKAEEEKLFEKVVFASVTNNPNLKRIQREIACGLGMDQLPEGLEVQSIASRINAKLRKLKTVLVIFDDVWTKLNLEELGVAFNEMTSDGHEGEGMKSKNLSSSDTFSSGKEGVNWKILFTSRDLNVLKIEMGTQKEFGIGKLVESEAWQMFKKISGERVECDHSVQVIANGIVEKCDGLPLAISALANALKGRDLHEWRSALSRLRKPSPNNFTGMYNSVYAAIEVSYSQLETEELKQILLLSSMLGETIFIQDLLKYSVGLGLFPQAITIEEARDELLTLISNLKAASLFIDGSDDEYFVMHDLIRDVAISIAHRDQHGLLLKDNHVPKEWSDMEAVKDFKWICLEYVNINGLPGGLESSQLSLFCIYSEDSRLEIPSEFFRGMQRLKVLDLTAMHMSSLPSSIRLLNNLHTLCLDQSFLGDISIIGELHSLKILSFLNSDMEELPAEIRGLTSLQLLDMSGCYKLTVVPPHVLENLSRLEELYLANSFDKWELEEHRNQRNASLVELEHLKSLVTLEVRIGDVEMIPSDLVFRDLIRYKIFIGDEVGNWKSSFHSSKIIRLKLQKDRSLNNLYNSVKKLPFKNTEELHLEGLIGVRNLVDEIDENGFQDLKYLFVRNSPDVEKIINSARNALPTLEVLFLHHLFNLEKIFQGRYTETSFLKLREIGVSCCDQLKNLFSSTVAKHLLGLQVIRVTECENMEEILDDKQQGSIAEIVDITEKAGMPEFGKQLRVLLLKHLPKLSSLNSSGSISLFNDQVVLPNLVELQLSWIDVSLIWETSVITSTCFENLTKLIIEGCHNLKYIFASTMARGLSKLAHLEIKECRRIGKVVLTEITEEGKNLIFPKLSFLLMEDLQSLVGFYSGSCIVEFPSLKQLQILNCPELKGFCVEAINSGGGDDIDHALFNDQVGLPSLESLTISHLKYLTNIWNSRQISATSFCKLKSLKVSWCEKLLMVFSSFEMLGRFWTSIEELRIVGCGSLTVIFEIEEFSETEKRDVKYSTLRELYFVNLPKLKHVWDKDPQGTLSFQNMESLIIEECRSLIDVFPTSIAKSLTQLQKLILRECGVEEIIAGARGGVDSQEVVEFKFPNLSSIKLSYLTRFKHFYREEKTLIDCPMLRKFDFFYLNKVAKNTGGVLNKLPFYSTEKIISQLENLSLSENDISMIQERQFQGDPIFKIKVLRIYGYHNIPSAIFPINFIGRFCNMEKLVLQNCRFTELFSPKVVCQVEEHVKHAEIETLSGIKKLKLVSLNDLKHVWSHDSLSALPNLQTLRLLACHDLISLSTSSATSFQNLTTLSVWHCNGITHLVSVLIAQSLVQLKNMTVGGCNLLTGVLRNAEEDEELIVTFDKLRSLRLYCLTRATSFCSGKSILKFPSLDQVIISQCPRLKIFCEGEIDAPVLCKVELNWGGDKRRWVSNLNTTVQRMYEEKVGFIGLQSLPLNAFSELIKIWHLQTPSELLNFRSLVNLEISNCHSLMYLLTPAMASSLVQLMELKIKNCGKLEKVILGDEEQHEIMFPQLRLILLEDCSGMASFYVGSNSLKLPELLDLDVKSCPKMATFANVTSSGILEEETPQYFFSNNKVEFPKLTHLVIGNVGSLNMIWDSQQDEDSFCQLNYLNVNSCKRLLHVFPFSMMERLKRLVKLQIWNCNLVEKIFESQGQHTSQSQANRQSLVETPMKFVFSNLTNLHLHNLPNLKCFFPQELIVEFPILTKLEVNGCDQVHTFASEYASFQQRLNKEKQLEVRTECHLFSVTKDTFSSLEELKLEKNFLMKEIWHGEHQADYLNKEDNIVFTNLKYFLLRNMPILASFCSSNCNFKFPSLIDLTVMGCPRMQHFSQGELLTPKLQSVKWTMNEDHKLWKDDLNGTIREFFSQKVGFSTLEYLKLSDFPELIPIWNQKPEENLRFNMLMSLEVSGVPSLKYLLTSSMALDLGKLQKLEVKNCDTMEQVIASEEGSQEMIFSKMENLWLENLPKLTSFCSRNSATFEKAIISHPLFDAKVEFPKLKRLVIKSMESLNMIWDSHLDEDSFYQLNYLSVDSCEKLLHIFPFSMVERLNGLDTLEIWNCDLLEKIFESQGHHAGQSQANQRCSVETPMKFVFSNLTNLHLHNLPNLKCFFPQELIVEFPILTNLEVNGCDQVQIFASEYASFQERLNKEKQREVRTKCHLFSVTKDTFSSLEELRVKNNRLMEDIWRGPNQADYLGEEKGDIFFTKLKYLELNNLHGLGSFCSSNCEFGFPSLEDMIVMGCPRMKSFSAGESQTPKLQIVKWMTDGDQGLWKGDLNATIQELFAKKVGYSTLEDLKLVEFPELISIWNKTPQNVSSVRMLKRLEVCNINSLSYLFTPTMALEFVQLEKLKVTNCDTMEEVIIEDGFQEIIFPKLKNLDLIHLPKLAWFCYENYLIFPCLYQLFIEGCPLLKTFISSSEDKYSNIPALFDAKVSLPKLERLIIDSMGSLNKIWEDQLEADAFCILNYLRVESCEKLLNIFSYDMLERLRKLDRVRVRNCSSVEEIVEYKGHAASEPHSQSTIVVDAMGFTLVFPNLMHLELYMLPKLKCVSTRVRSIECPLLKLLQVNGCDEVQIFASEYPGFQIPTGDEEQEISPQCPLFGVTKGTFPSLTALKLRWNNNMKDLWYGQDPGSFFPKLVHIELIDFPEQSAQLASFFVQSLPEFCVLVVNGVSHEISQENKASSSQQVHQIQWDQWL